MTKQSPNVITVGLLIYFISLTASRYGESRISNRTKAPDLMTLPHEELYTERKDGKTLLRLDGVIYNAGNFPFIIYGKPNGSPAYQAHSCIELSKRDIIRVMHRMENGEKPGECQYKNVGQVIFHTGHGHEHLNEVATYELRRGSATGPLVSVSQKVSFALMDIEEVSLGAYSFEENAYISDVQVISPGWADVYGASLPGQEIDITGVADGVYYLIVIVNEARKFVESNYQNNRMVTRIRLSNGARTVEAVR